MESLTTVSEYIEMNNDQIELIKIKCLKNRIKNECNILYKEYHNVLVEVNSDKNITIKAVEFTNTNVITYKFLITHLFPFYPPKIFVNDRPYLNILQMTGEYEKYMLKKLKGKDCLCCYSLNCSVNWSPAIKLYHIINEIKNTLKFKRDIINLLLADKIKIKYNIPYAYIEQYLVFPISLSSFSPNKPHPIEC
jgi:hypothetical protein